MTTLIFLRKYQFNRVHSVIVSRILLPDAGAPTGLFQYYIKIIPTEFTNEWGYKVSSNEYTVTERYRPFIMPTSDLPAVSVDIS